MPRQARWWVLVVLLVWFAMHGHPITFLLLIGLSLALGFLLIGTLLLTGSLAGKPNGKGPFNVEVPKVSTDNGGPTAQY